MHLISLAVVVLLGLASSAFGEEETNHTEIVQECNEYADKLFEKMSYDKENKEELDPFPLADEISAWTYKLTFVSVRVSVESREGSLEGLRTLRRDGDCVRVTESDDGIRRLYLPIRVDRLVSVYKSSVKIQPPGLTKEATINGSIGESNGKIIVQVKEDGTPNVESIEFARMDEMKVQIKGLRVPGADWVVNFLTKGFITVFQKIWKRVFAKDIVKLLNRVIESVGV